jgi:hypothetical protein
MTNTQLIDYALYSMNDKQGRVPFLDNATLRAQLDAAIVNILGISP